MTAPRLVVRLLAACWTLVLGLGVFLVAGARAANPVTRSDAVVRYANAPGFAGLPGWNRPLTGGRPAPGVYLYATTGFARIDRLGVRRDYPATTARIVRLGPGCQWREQVAIFNEHLETYSACAQRGDQIDTGFGTRLTYFFVPGVTDLVCEPGGTRTATGRTAGAAVTFRCADEDHDVVATGTATFRGVSAVTVEGRATPCRRVTIVTVLSGTTTGAASRELCTTPDTGLVLSETRTVGVGVRSRFVGRVAYTEQATFTLQSLTPLT